MTGNDQMTSNISLGNNYQNGTQRTPLQRFGQSDHEQSQGYSAEGTKNFDTNRQGFNARSDRYLTIDETQTHIANGMQRCFTQKENGNILNILDTRATDEMHHFQEEIRNETN